MIDPDGPNKKKCLYFEYCVCMSHILYYSSWSYGFIQFYRGTKTTYTVIQTQIYCNFCSTKKSYSVADRWEQQTVDNWQLRKIIGGKILSKLQWVLTGPYPDMVLCSATELYSLPHLFRYSMWTAAVLINGTHYYSHSSSVTQMQRILEKQHGVFIERHQMCLLVMHASPFLWLVVRPKGLYT